METLDTSNAISIANANHDPAAIDQTRQRDVCNICKIAFDPKRHESALVPCHVQAFRGRAFRLWRCDGCRSIHCLDVVDLDHYYSRYPFAQAKLDWVFRIFYRNLARRFIEHGMTISSRLLDYGCANGLFCQYLHECGHTYAYGYDPYSATAEFSNKETLDRGPFEFILLQDVLEHVESPSELLAQLDEHLAPGGHILIGTPNAENIDLAKQHIFPNELHAPYHLHIPTPNVLKRLGAARGWTPTRVYERSYHDRPWFGLNTRAAKVYQQLIGGSFDALFGPMQLGRMLTSPRWVFYAVVGYWMSYKSDVSVMFRK